jgi:glutathione synthase/RimK-type ligase-like ATP-grasp enzyme
MIFIITNKQDITVDYVVLKLQERNLPFFRFNTEDFPTNHKIDYTVDRDGGFWRITGKKGAIDSRTIKAAWYRRPGAPQIDPMVTEQGLRDYAFEESVELLQALYALINVRWLNDPLAIRKAESKPYQLALARDLGFNIPTTLITTDRNKVDDFYESCLKKVVVKPLRRAVFKSDGDEFVIFTSKIAEEDRSAFEGVQYSPSIYQQLIDKTLDIRVTVVGDKIFSAAIHSQNSYETKVDWRRGDRIDLPHEVFELPLDLQEQCLSLVKRLGLKFGAIDLALGRSGNFYFLEINPNGQWAWIEVRLGLDISGAIINILTEDDQ